MSSASSGRPPWTLRVVTKMVRGAVFLVAVVVTMIVIMSVWWRVLPEKDIDVLVYDQTVPDEEATERRMLQQLLEYHRIDYSISDYVGAEPGGVGRHGTWPTDRPDLIVLADVYGVYLDDFGVIDDYGTNRVTDAFTHDQARDIQRWVETGTPAYAEFALVTEPTPPKVAHVFEDVFGFTATTWTGRVVEDLSDLSPKVTKLGPSPWPYHGPGMIFVTAPVAGQNPEPRLVVLTADMLDEQLLRVIGGPPGSIPGESTFDRWFSVVEPRAGTDVDAWFEVGANALGTRALTDAGIPLRFPALLRTERTLYFAGDGLDDDTPFRLRHLKGGAVFARLVTGREFRFTYQILEPSISWLLDLPEPVNAESAPTGGG